MKSVNFVIVQKIQSLLHNLKTLLFTFIFLFTAIQCHAFETPWIDGKAQASQVRLIGEFKSIGELTGEIKFGLEFRLKSGWHIYWKNPGLIGFPPKITAQLPTAWKSELLFPAPFRIAIKDRADAYAFGYERNVLYPLILQGPRLKENFKGEIKVDYLVCDIQCVPETALFTVEIPLSKESFSAFYKAIAQAVDSVPQKSSSFRATRVDERKIQIEFITSEKVSDVFLYSPEKVEWASITKLPPSSPTNGESQIWEIESKAKTPPFEFTAVWNAANARTGISNQITPANLANSNQVAATAGSETSGSVGLILALLFAFLGGLILNLMPCVLPVVGIKTISLLKLREKNISYRMPVVLTIVGILFSFIALALVTIFIKSLGYQIGWGFQFQSPAFVTFMVAIIFLFSLNLFDVFEVHLGSRSTSVVSNLRGSFFEGVFATLLATPCSAPFLGTALTFALSQSSIILVVMFFAMGLGLSTPYLLLLVFPSLLKFLPKPGHWMNALKRFLGYSLLFAIFFLLYVVHQQTETLFIFALLGILVMIFILLRELRTFARWALILLLILWAMKVSEEMKRGVISPETSQVHGIHTQVFSEEKLIELLAAKKTVFVLITADWCLTCKYNEKTVYETEWFQEMLRKQNIEFMVADWTQRDIKIGNFLEKHGRVAIPFSMLIDQNHEVILPELVTRSAVENAVANFERRN